MPRRSEQAPDLLAWDLAEAVARHALRFSAPFPKSEIGRLQDDFRRLTARAETLVTEATGLTSAAGPAAVEVVDRGAWVKANIASFRALLAPLAKRMAESTSSLKASLQATNTSIAGGELGLLLAWMSGRVLGQFDLLPGGEPSSGGVIFYVAPNIIGLERQHGFDPEEFRLWIAIHEVTHRMQFTGVPWMRSYFLGLVDRGASATTPDMRTILNALLRAGSEIRSGRNPIAEAGLMGLFASTEQLATLREAQGLMSFLEGHGNAIMSRAGKGATPNAEHFGAVLAKRRRNVSPIQRGVQQALGLEAKMRQYSEGEAFVHAVEGAGGDALLAKIWNGPENLPSAEEIHHPERWIARVDAAHSVRA